ncbi:hypothetical protein KY338_05460 [Candidatus Woesearchaeota archaeon]|nr:hypothetical protein [Candidatus Woesearchaeota archaeon]MBW3006350.1 hypothetical protein [Candidatus Woesearchaeota archaeon]
MKILGYEMRPIHAAYAGLLALAVGCGGSNEPYEYDSPKTEQMYENVRKNMELHGRLNHPGKWSAILLKAAERDMQLTNPLTLDDLKWIVDNEVKRGDEIYDWEDLRAPPKRDEPAEKGE